jgi:hypothetical protein
MKGVEQSLFNMKGVDETKFNQLTIKQKKYFRMMYGKSGVLFLTAEPGVAKSAIMRRIADKLGFQYFDIRLSMVDEIDVGLFPFRKEMEIDLEDGSGQNVRKLISVMSYAIPEWAYMSNLKPTIIHFEELNRAPLAVRNAALQILLERAIGTTFKFNSNVYMVSSGNLGEMDGTDVEEFDRALNNRLIHYKHSLTLPEWIEDFANEHVHPVIVNFLKSNEEHFLHSFDEKRSKNQEAYATPRSWTFLSDYIVNNYGMTSSITEFINDVRELGASYIGDGANSRFIRYLDESLKFGINDLLNRYDDIKDQLKDLTRDKKSELLNSLKQKNIMDLNDKQKENVKRFILTVSEDEAVAYILKILDDEYKYMKVNDNDNDIAEEFLTDERFAKFYEAILQHVPNIDND